MKRTLFFMLLSAWLSAPATWAEDFVVDGIYYNILSSDDKTVEVTTGNYSGDVTILATVTYEGSEYRVTAIGDKAFYFCTGLTSVMIPNSVTSIGEEAFYFCTGLTSVTIPESVQTIGDRAFSDCDGLTEFKGKFATDDHCSLIVNDTLFIAFAPKCEVTEYVIPNGVQTIGNYAFYGCDGLTEITIPNSVTTIGSSAFSCCISLTSVTIPNSVTSIGDDAFWWTGLTSVTIPNSVTSIGNGTFEWCKSLTSVTIPESVTTIGHCAFYGCTGLKKFEGKFAANDGRCLIVNDTLIAFAPDGLSSYTISDDVKVIGIGVFVNCSSLTSVTIGESVISIGNEAFCGCSGLMSVTIPESVTTIGYDAFRECTSLTEVTIPESVTTIEVQTFTDCTSLMSIMIPNSITSIGYDAFCGCTSLTTVTIPESVTTIEVQAFYGCTGLRSVTAYNPTPVDIGTSVFYGVDNCKLYVPKGSEEDYRNAKGWSKFGEILPIDESSAITETRQDKADGHVAVYNLQGVPVLETDDAADLKTLQNGAYIVNGKKMIIAR